MSNETPREALASVLDSIIGKEARDAKDVGLRPSGGKELEAWNYVANHFEMLAKSTRTADDILEALKKEGGWELVKIIPKSIPFTGIYPPGTK